MSAFGPKRTCASALHMSAFGGKADMTSRCLLSRSLLGVKRTSPVALHMSASDPKRTLVVRLHPVTRNRWHHRQHGIDDARVSKCEVLIRRGEKWFRYGALKRNPSVRNAKRTQFASAERPALIRNRANTDGG